MPRIDVTNDELHRILTERTNVRLVNGHCEDYPCCGHTPDDPCTREWYDHPDAFDTSIPGQEHRLCDHENNDCYVYEYEEDVDPADCEHGDASQRKRGWRCDICYADLVMVTDVSPRAYPSKAVPGLMVEIPVLGWHFEVA
jgi:hypothetical protein